MNSILSKIQFFGIGILLCNVSFAQTKSSNTLGGALARKYPLYVEVTSNKFEDSVKSFLTSELLARKFRLIDRNELDKLIQSEYLRRMQGKTPQQDAAKIIERGSIVAQWLKVETSFSGDEFSGALDSVSWVLYHVPLVPKNVPQKAVLSEKKESKEILMAMINSAEGKK